MATSRLNPQTDTFGRLKKIYTFHGGLVTKPAKEDVPDGATPYSKSCAYDKRRVLQKIWGTQELITGGTNQAFNKFITNPVYALYPFTASAGDKRLIIQGVASSDSKMSLFSLDPQGTYPAAVTAIPTRILGASDELKDKRKCSFATYKGRLYIWNGADDLQYWTGNSTVWRKYHSDKDEKFKFLCSHGRRLWAAGSGSNPSRIIYTDLDYCNFVHYFNLDANKIELSGSDSNRDESPIMWICEFRDSLLIFKVNCIYRLFGDPDYGINFDLVSANTGTISGASVQVHNNICYFMAKDGIWAYGDTAIAASAEDQYLKVEPNILRISSEIDNYWEDNFTLPDPEKIKEKVWSGATDFAAMTALTSCQSNSSTVTENPDVINASLLTSDPVEVEKYDTTSATWMALKSVGKYAYWSQTAKLGTTAEASVPYAVGFYLKESGTVTASHIMDLYICDGKTTNTEPDFDNVYAEATLTGTNLVGISALAFDSGSEAPVVGNTLKLTAGGTATGVLNRTVLLTGTWAGGTATGYFYITSKTGTWADNGTIGIDGGTADIATVNELAVGDSSPISTGCWVYFPIEYWNFPQNLYDGDNTDPPVFFMAFKTTAMDDTNYISWNYTTVAGGGSYANGRIYNSDEATPASQDLCDFTFSLYNNGFRTTSSIQTDTLDVRTESKTSWGSVQVTYNTDTLGDYTRNMDLDEIKYEVLAADTGWDVSGSGTVVENGGGIVGTGNFLRLLISFKRPTGSTWDKNDSFSLQSIRVNYRTQAIVEVLVDSVVWKNSYICTIQSVTDTEAGQES